MPTHEADGTPEPLFSDDAYRWRPADPESLAADLEFVAEELEWAMLASGGQDFMRLYEAAKRIGQIADSSFVTAELD